MITSNTDNYRRDKIRLSDGREGYQYCYRDDDGDWVLYEVLITHKRDGTTCRHSYSQRPSYRDRVFGFADLGNVNWKINQ